MAAEYYCLIAGLTEYSFADKNRRISIDQVRGEIKDAITPEDAKALNLLYLYYDIQNLVNMMHGSSLPFNTLGNLTKEQLDAELNAQGSDDEPFVSLLPSQVRLSLDIYMGVGDTDEDEQEKLTITQQDMERRLYADFYALSATSKCEFLRNWCEIDRKIRSIITLRRASELGLDSAPMLIGVVDDEREFEYYTELMAVLDTKDFVERETKMDALRWHIAEDLSEHNYFDMAALLSYLVRVNILYRWSALDKAVGEERFRSIVKGFTDNVKIE